MVDLVGLLAGSMVLATFSMRSMLWLRVLALGSNVAFIAYGLMLSLWPIWLLHLLLFPMNTLRLVQILAASGIWCRYWSVGEVSSRR